MWPQDSIKRQKMQSVTTPITSQPTTGRLVTSSYSRPRPRPTTASPEERCSHEELTTSSLENVEKEKTRLKENKQKKLDLLKQPTQGKGGASSRGKGKGKGKKKGKGPCSICGLYVIYTVSNHPLPILMSSFYVVTI